MSFTIWITGITASGKTTLGKDLYQNLFQKGFINIEFLDGDELRKRIGGNHGHSLRDRYAVLKKIVKLAKELNQENKIVIVSTISHKVEMRKYARRELENFIEIYLSCHPDVCARRDYKGLYKKAKQGELDLFVGVTEPYEESEKPELIVHTDKFSREECFHMILNMVVSRLTVNYSFEEVA